jgi:hypothetical protein
VVRDARRSASQNGELLAEGKILDQKVRLRRSQASYPTQDERDSGEHGERMKGAGVGSTTARAWTRGSIRRVQAIHCQRGWGFGERQASIADQSVLFLGPGSGSSARCLAHNVGKSCRARVGALCHATTAVQ